MTAAAEPPATKPVVHSFPSDLVEAEAAQRAKEDIRRKVEAELVAALTSLETAKNAKSFGGSDKENSETCLLYTSPSPRDQRGSRMPSSA